MLPRSHPPPTLPRQTVNSFPGRGCGAGMATIHLKLTFIILLSFFSELYNAVVIKNNHFCFAELTFLHIHFFFMQLLLFSSNAFCIPPSSLHIL